jgi:hypothetical protein
METQELKIRLLDLAIRASSGMTTISANNVAGLQLKSTLEIAQDYYKWVTEAPAKPIVPEPVEPVSND